MRLRSIERRGPHRRPGAVMVEAAIVMTIAFTLLFTISEYGRLIMARQLLNNAAREGARQALVGTASKTTSQIQTTVLGLINNQGLTGVNVQVYQADTSGNNVGLWTDAAFGDGIAVQVDADFQPTLPALSRLPNPLHIQVRSILRSEAN